MIKNPNGDLLVAHIACCLKQKDDSVGCGSSDGMSIYYHKDHEPKNHQLKCFVCMETKYITEDDFNTLDIASLSSYKDNIRNKYQTRKNVQKMINPNHSEIPNEFLKGTFRPIRGLTLDTLQKYGAFTLAVKRPDPDNPNEGAYKEVIIKHVYPYYDKDGNLIAQKVRHVFDSANPNTDKKGFEAIGDKGAWNKVQLFGQNIFPAGSAMRITVTEGEIDAMSVYQMLGSKYPAVSISNGAHSVRKMLEDKNIYKYLDSFDEIIVCFDNDEHGQKASEVFCEIFPAKTKIVPLAMKDANDYLLAGKVTEFAKDAWWKAKPYTPDGLALSSEFIADVVNSTVARGAIPYPFKELNRKLFGMRQAELTTWVAGTGSGKSTMQRELVNHIRKTTSPDVRIGMLMLEESPNKTAVGLVGLEMGKPLLLYDLDQQLPAEDRVLKDLVITKEEREAAANKILGDDRFVIMRNSFQGADLDNIVKKVRQMNKVYGCKHIILDHISIIVSGQDQQLDERKSLDKVTTNLRRLVEETGVDLHLVSHLKRPDGKGFEDGAEISLSDIRGSAAIAQLSDNVIGLERNQQHEDNYLRNIIRFRVLKCRVTGLTGLGGFGYYNPKTGRIEEVSNADYEAYVQAYEENKQRKEDKNFKNNVDFQTNM
jgi:twinkle protein